MVTDLDRAKSRSVFWTENGIKEYDIFTMRLWYYFYLKTVRNFANLNIYQSHESNKT